MALASSSPAARNQRVIRVQLIDDSAVVRGLTRRWLTGLLDIELVTVSTDGAKGVKDAGEIQPDVILLDVEMPNMSGLDALPHLRRVAPKARIIMASTLTHKGARTTIQALSKGATDYIGKPEAGQLGGAEAYRDTLIEKIRALGGPPVPVRPQPVQRPVSVARPAAPAKRAVVFKRPDVIVVASSTGGPQALQTVLPELTKKTDLPILVVQHMPPTFTAILAEHLDAVCRHKVAEGQDGEVVVNGRIYIAPGGYHMEIVDRNGRVTIGLNQREPVNFCRPAADVLFKAAAAAYGNRTLGLVLTGMGQDGCTGTKTLNDAGARVLVQDQETSIVWGMPGAVYNAGLAHSMHPLNDLAGEMLAAIDGVSK